jgi:mRNA interferase MazF
MPQYQPDRADFVTLEFTPNTGTEQGGRRPALILSPKMFNVRTGLAVLCPITNQMKGGGFEVQIPSKCRVTGVLLVDQMRSLDWLSRKVAFHSRAPVDFVEDVVARFIAIITPEKLALVETGT